MTKNPVSTQHFIVLFVAVCTTGLPTCDAFSLLSVPLEATGYWNAYEHNTSKIRFGQRLSLPYLGDRIHKRPKRRLGGVRRDDAGPELTTTTVTAACFKEISAGMRASLNLCREGRKGNAVERMPVSKMGLRLLLGCFR